MSTLITLFIVDLLEDLFNFLGNKMLESIVHLTLYAEEYMKGLGSGVVNNLIKITLDFGVSLIVLKFLKKGFEMYVLWSDGDADAEPIQLVVNFFRAMAIALSFPVIYGWMAEITIDFSNKILNALGLDAKSNFTALLSNIATSGLFTVICFLVFFVIFVLLYIQFIKNGLEILILRLGTPLACVGLMDADKGVFKPYIQKFLQAMITIIVQTFLAKLGLALMFAGHIIWGIAAIFFAVKTPRFLQEFLIMPNSGGGVTQSLYTVQMLRSIVK